MQASPMTALPVTAVAAALLGLIGIVLTCRVMAARRAARISLGDAPAAAYRAGQEHAAPPLMLAQRAHLNFCENVPLGLILLGLAELYGAPFALRAAFAAMLVTGRLLHPFGVGRRAPNLFRAGSVLLTLLEMLGASVFLLYEAAV